jgi:hypothetical protein
MEGITRYSAKKKGPSEGRAVRENEINAIERGFLEAPCSKLRGMRSLLDSLFVCIFKGGMEHDHFALNHVGIF